MEKLPGKALAGGFKFPLGVFNEGKSGRNLYVMP
jgi:hypothetical protein